jgi:hypothetical protein
MRVPAGGIMGDYDFRALLRDPLPVDRIGLVVERGERGVRANVPHVVYHSPTGYNYGYAGAGPADLALSTLCALIPPPDPAAEERVRALGGSARKRADADDSLWSLTTPDGVRISRLAMRLHGFFQDTFVVAMKDDHAHVPIHILTSWIEVQSRALLERSLPL